MPILKAGVLYFGLVFGVGSGRHSATTNGPRANFRGSYYGQVSFATLMTGPSPTTATLIVTVPDSPGKQCATPV